MKKLNFWLLTCTFTFYLLPFGFYSFAQQDNRLTALSKQIIEADTQQDLYAPFEELKDFYFRDNKYSEFVDYLPSLGQKKKTLEPFINYYIALTRYQHLKYLEEKQLWDEYFSQGNNYRDELTQSAEKTIDITSAKEPLHIYARLVLWQFHKDQQDSFAESSLSDLMSSVLSHSSSSKDPKPIKEVADKLLSYGEKGKSKELYKIYAQKIITSGIKDEELMGHALTFYKEGNLELAENMYDAYINIAARAMPKEKLTPILTDIAKAFVYKDDMESDPSYAEKIFKRLEEIGGKEIFDQELIYLRAFNLEKAKEYPESRDVYVDLTLRFPTSSHRDEALFKVGLITTYVLRDKKEGKTYFGNLIQREKDFTPQAISSFYQLGLLSQWEDDKAGAKGYYNKLIEVAGENYQETVTLTKERLKEIEEGKPIEYNLKTFLDLSLKEGYATFDMTKLDVRCNPYKAKKDENVTMSSTAYTSPTGCMQVELQYLWSGHLGENKPSTSQSSFETSYTTAGTKEINLVVVSPTGVIDRTLDMVDAY
jgi:TolA-binding protein